jgi:DNA-binding MarR family transcriptional regulator
VPSQEPSPDVLAAADGPGQLARRLHQAHTRLWQEELGVTVTGPQFAVLAVLRGDGPLDQGTLGTRAHLDKSSAAPVVERLHLRGFLTVTWDPEDRRRKLLEITAAGAELVERLAPRAAGIGERLLGGLSTEERARFVELLRKIL